MAHPRTEYKVISQHQQAQFQVELNKLGLEGWKVVSFSTAQAQGSPVVFSAILERPLAG